MQSVSREGAIGLETRWTDSTIKGRDGILDYLGDLANSDEGVPRLMVLEGPRGAGTSTLARVYLDLARRRLQSPVTIRVDVSALSRSNGDPVHGISAALMRRFVPNSRFQGYSTPRLMSLFLRRASVEGRPLIIWLDQLRSNLTSLDSVVGPLREPMAFMGAVSEAPYIVVILSGTLGEELSDSLAGKRISVPTLPRAVVQEILVDRALRSGMSFTPESREKAMDILGTRNFDLTTLDELAGSAIQRAGCHGIISDPDVEAPVTRERPRTNKRLLELRILQAVRKAGGDIPVGQLREEVARGFAQTSQPVPSPSCLRRQIGKLERLGLVERELRMGGLGGTRSTISLSKSESLRNGYPTRSILPSCRGG